MKKNRNFSSYWDISGLILWFIIFLLGMYVSKLTLQDALQIPSVLLLCCYFFNQLITWGLMDRTIVKYRNKYYAGASKNSKRKKMGLEEVEKISLDDFRKGMESKSIVGQLPYMVLYLSLTIASLFI